MTEVLLDNFTLQGAYAYLHEKKRGKLYQECISNLIESIVIYDKVYVPSDVLTLNEKCGQIVRDFDGIIIGKSNHRTPDIHHHLIKDEIVSQFLPIVSQKNLFQHFNIDEAEDIEEIGHPYINSIGVSMPSRTKLSFEMRAIYYTWYCVNLAASLQVNYVPNPTRTALFNDADFMEKTPFAAFRKDVLKYFQDVRKRQDELLVEVFESLNGVSVDLPLVYKYVKKENSDDMIGGAIELRKSDSAVAFRKYFDELEGSLQKGGNRELLLESLADIKKLAERWSHTLTKQKATRKLTITDPFLSVVSTDIEIPWPNIGALDRKPHFVFVHTLLSSS